MHPFGGPREERSFKVELFEAGIVQEAVKATHQSQIQAIIVLVGYHVDHVEIAGQEPWPGAQRAELANLLQERRLELAIGWTIDPCEAPIDRRGEVS
jgi:hypothetical protein